MTHYRDVLREHYLKKKNRNESYSLRSYAKLLGLNPGGLSRLLAGKMSLSLKRAIEICEKLELNESETEQFLSLIHLEKAKSLSAKNSILKKMERSGHDLDHDLSIDQFRTISEWYSMAILRIAATPKMNRSPLVIARTLKISSVDCYQAISRLKRLELIREDKDGQISKIPENEVHIKFGASDLEASRKYYASIVERFSENLSKETPHTRAIATRPLAFDESQLKTVQELELKFLDELRELSQKAKSPQKIYQALTTVFELKGK